MGKKPSIPQPSWRQVFENVDLTNDADARLVVERVIRDAKRYGGVHAQPDAAKVDMMVDDVVQRETWNIGKHTSWTNTGNGRDAMFSSGPQRLRLHADIIESLFSKVRPDDDEDISIPQGGALPKSGIQRANQAIFVIGLPASGKSRVARMIAERAHAMTIDPDDAKRMLPEYRNGLNAMALHNESTEIVKGVNSLFREALSKGMNVVVPTVGERPKELREILAERDRLNSSLHGYHVYLVHVDCPVEVAAYRSLLRLRETGRYVPLAKLLVEVGGRVKRAFRRVKHEKWAGYAAYSTREYQKPPVLVENHRAEWIVQNKGTT